MRFSGPGDPVFLEAAGGIHAGFHRQAPQQAKHGDRGQNPNPAALHRESRARACRKLRSLFISANFRKQDCSSCQAATPSRVAASASLGT